MLHLVDTQGTRMFGDVLRQRLSELDMSQADLARALTQRGHRVTRANVSHWINGRNDPPLEDRHFRQVLAASLELSTNELMRRIGYAHNISRWSEDALRGADLIDLLPDEAKGLALDYLDLLMRRYGKTD